MFHNIRRNYSHHVMQEIGEFDQKKSNIKWYGKTFDFHIRKIVFVSEQFMNSTLALLKTCQLIKLSTINLYIYKHL